MDNCTLYRLTSPNGLKYIGQTRGFVEYRWNQHKNSAIKNKKGCTALKGAINEYGWENFHKEVILTCKLDQIDYYEIKYIYEENTMVPNGYNIKPGGQHVKIDTLPDELRLFYLSSIRKHNNYDLPSGVVEINLPHRNKGKGEYGFKVLSGEHTHTFISKHQTMEEKLQEALECYKTISDNKEYVRKNSHKWNKDIVKDFDIPQGVKYRKDKNGFEVHVKFNGKIHRKNFTKKKFTLEQNLRFAIDHLNSIKVINN